MAKEHLETVKLRNLKTVAMATRVGRLSPKHQVFYSSLGLRYPENLAKIHAGVLEKSAWHTNACTHAQPHTPGPFYNLPPGPKAWREVRKHTHIQTLISITQHTYNVGTVLHCILNAPHTFSLQCASLTVTPGPGVVIRGAIIHPKNTNTHRYQICRDYLSNDVQNGEVLSILVL